MAGFGAKLGGGQFNHAFIAAGFSAAFKSMINDIGGTNSANAAIKEGNLGKLEIHKVDRIIASALIGGTASKLSGGKFANGALSGALAQMYNGEETHKSAIELPHSLFFDGKKLKWLDGNGDVVTEWEATSGASGSTNDDQDVKNKGPIPEGKYIVEREDLQNWSDLPLKHKFYAYVDRGQWPGGTYAWGEHRIWITQLAGHDYFERSNFSIHGGITSGSAGCIDLTNQMESFTEHFTNHFNTQHFQSSLNLEVKY